MGRGEGKGTGLTEGLGFAWEASVAHFQEQREVREYLYLSFWKVGRPNKAACLYADGTEEAKS